MSWKSTCAPLFEKGSFHMSEITAEIFTQQCYKASPQTLNAQPPPSSSLVIGYFWPKHFC